jgi:hypothetical protein
MVGLFLILQSNMIYGRIIFHQPLNPNSGTIDISILDSLERNSCFSRQSIDDGPPTRDEIVTALKSHESYESPGVDEISHQQYKHCPERLVERLDALF